MSTVRVTLEAADDLPEAVREALQALITAATADGMGVEYSHRPSAQVATEVGGHRSDGGYTDIDEAIRTERALQQVAAMTFTGR